MAKGSAWVCDRPGCQIVVQEEDDTDRAPDGWLYIEAAVQQEKVRQNPHPEDLHGVDLCFGCRESFRKWWNGET